KESDGGNGNRRKSHHAVVVNNDRHQELSRNKGGDHCGGAETGNEKYGRGHKKGPEYTTQEEPGRGLGQATKVYGRSAMGQYNEPKDQSTNEKRNEGRKIRMFQK